MATGTGLQSLNTTVPSAQDENLTALGHRNIYVLKETNVQTIANSHKKKNHPIFRYAHHTKSENKTQT
jgi:hypothetical protein